MWQHSPRTNEFFQVSDGIQPEASRSGTPTGYLVSPLVLLGNLDVLQALLLLLGSPVSQVRALKFLMTCSVASAVVNH